MTMKAGIENVAGKHYTVEFLGGPGNWSTCAQGTTANNDLVFTVTSSAGTLTTYTYQPSVWAGARRCHRRASATWATAMEPPASPSLRAERRSEPSPAPSPTSASIRRRCSTDPQLQRVKRVDDQDQTKGGLRRGRRRFRARAVGDGRGGLRREQLGVERRSSSGSSGGSSSGFEQWEQLGVQRRK